MMVTCVSMSSMDHFHIVLFCLEHSNYIHEKNNQKKKKKKYCSILAENTCPGKDEINFSTLTESPAALRGSKRLLFFFFFPFSDKTRKDSDCSFDILYLSECPRLHHHKSINSVELKLF